MPCLTGNRNNIQVVGPTVEILISHPDLEGEPKQSTVVKKITALIDTGASGTVIQVGIAKELNLIQRGIVPISTPSCKDVPCQAYDVSIVFIGFPVRRPLVRVIEAPLQGQNIQCLIGRDVLANALFIYSGYTNQFTLAF